MLRDGDARCISSGGLRNDASPDPTLARTKMTLQSQPPSRDLPRLGDSVDYHEPALRLR
jgi:hypothetical protein